MSFTATVENGAIKIPEGVHLPDGTQVRIEQIEEEPTLGASLSEFIGVVDDLPADFASNLDHYLYGHPKKP